MLYLVGHLYLHHTRHDIDLMEPRLTARTAGRATNSDSLKRTDRDRDGVARQVVATSARYLSPIVRWRPVGSPDRTNVRLFVVIAHVACPPHEVPSPATSCPASCRLCEMWQTDRQRSVQITVVGGLPISDISWTRCGARSTIYDL